MNPRDLIRNDINIIKGDACFRDVIITGVDVILIESVYFTCSDLGITKQLEYIQEKQCYRLSLASAETKNYSEMVSDYDLTIKFTDQNYKTVLYRGKLYIKEKHNPVEV